MYGGQTTFIPIRVNASGVMPIIFASSFIMFPQMIISFIPKLAESKFGVWWMRNLTTSGGTWWGSLIYYIFMVVFIIFFAYFYASIQYNPIEIANNLKKNGGFIPGFRPGKPTADFIKKVLNKVTLFGAIYLGVVAILPLLIGKIVNVAALSIGGTSVIIVVGVALETVQALESQMLMRQYKGFLE